MDTSNSTNRLDWRARALVFSGRADPEWTVERGLGEQLEGLWRALPEAGESPPNAPPLGYRGCVLRHVSGREYHVFGGFVALILGGEKSVRRDAERAFERLLLSSAPAGLLPLNLFRMNGANVNGSNQKGSH